jgi:membrane-associated HD superfamily phosphohydrolase
MISYLVRAVWYALWVLAGVGLLFVGFSGMREEIKRKEKSGSLVAYMGVFYLLAGVVLINLGIQWLALFSFQAVAVGFIIAIVIAAILLFAIRRWKAE